LVLAGGTLRTRPPRRQDQLGARRSLVLMVAVDHRRARCCGPLRRAVVVAAALAGLDSADRLAGVLPGGPRGRLARHRPYRGLGVGDPVGLAVVLDGGGGLPPGPPPPGRLGQRAELVTKVAGLVVIQCEAAGATLPG
jgi:hypothetical protein